MPAASLLHAERAPCLLLRAPGEPGGASAAPPDAGQPMDQPLHGVKENSRAGVAQWVAQRRRVMPLRCAASGARESDSGSWRDANAARQCEICGRIHIVGCLMRPRVRRWPRVWPLQRGGCGVARAALHRRADGDWQAPPQRLRRATRRGRRERKLERERPCVRHSASVEGRRRVRRHAERKRRAQRIGGRLRRLVTHAAQRVASRRGRGSGGGGGGSGSSSSGGAARCNGARGGYSLL